ncbi:nicotinate-nucleotide adenylyltransferase [Carnobacterium maltaromaticum]|uniref:nicotinate-nucleotide adenylyltransferase n=1 Tax=Carnobacterium maltaromaticum TaxID=2751 RepID=UPI000704964F|nr:nicotinate-nucleotide adenylyltransferase [Carnobacterium maltaromaticum]TFJ28941.1 nicotinate-nucleotide adenylyltransferase [Carnobacterium maltaromaticum]TFJ32639.1 nicotinate-nucleotide adenylyltransferase [Carnobacterium maltaromaticum]TFJ36667.1 nicotinate-nucleotide adenylyltransferase [Carnobacterium maltaromaticum]TFJ39254.1 nicotinate-nucleotide adenylyltransferase [Carnobacterium maltaromaticum]TFJ46362.1 nicotinate-nucleotide adenylyltransferase [Carnobacterium maltaromaticum]
MINVQSQTNVLTEVESLPEERIRVGIIGGTFNPPHIGHLVIADQVCQQLGLDKVYFMPDANPPHIDKKEAIAAEHRVVMVEKAIEGNPLFGLESCEIQRGGISYTFDTMLELTKAHPEIDYYFIIGGDMVDYLPKWYRIDELIQMVQFVAVKRPNYADSSPYPLIWVDVPAMEISSTGLRKKIKNGCSVQYLIPDKTLAYIKEKELYQND